jgi:hypothetical protein
LAKKAEFIFGLILNKKIENCLAEVDTARLISRYILDWKILSQLRG